MIATTSNSALQSPRLGPYPVQRLTSEAIIQPYSAVSTSWKNGSEHASLSAIPKIADGNGEAMRGFGERIEKKMQALDQSGTKPMNKIEN